MPRFDLLNQLANFLDDLPSDKFHMPQWASPDRTKQSCGTAGCAAGWAATIFHKMGWTINLDYPCLKYKELGGSRAFAEFFGIPITEAWWITIHIDNSNGNHPGYLYEYNLNRGHDVTPRHAADRIRKVIIKLGGKVTEDYPILPKTALAAVEA